MKPNLKRLLAVLVVFVAVISIAAPIAGARQVIGDDPALDQPVPARTAQSRTRPNKPQRPHRPNAKPRRCPGSERMIARVQGCVK